MVFSLKMLSSKIFKNVLPSSTSRSQVKRPKKYIRSKWESKQGPFVFKKHNYTRMDVSRIVLYYNCDINIINDLNEVAYFSVVTNIDDDDENISLYWNASYYTSGIFGQS